MAQQWYIRAQGKLVGPVDSSTLRHLAASGKVRPDDQVSLDSDRTIDGAAGSVGWPGREVAGVARVVCGLYGAARRWAAAITLRPGPETPTRASGGLERRNRRVPIAPGLESR